MDQIRRAAEEDFRPWSEDARRGRAGALRRRPLGARRSLLLLPRARAHPGDTVGICVVCSGWRLVEGARGDEPRREHRWSGWPGAYCLDCGAEDPTATCLSDHPAGCQRLECRAGPCPGVPPITAR